MLQVMGRQGEQKGMGPGPSVGSRGCTFSFSGPKVYLGGLAEVWQQ